MEVLLVVTGDPKISSLSLNLRYGVRPGSRYLVRIPKLRSDSDMLSFNEDLETIIPVWAGEKLDELKVLSPSIVVLRTINIRIDDLESLIRRGNSELAPLKALKQGN